MWHTRGIIWLELPCPGYQLGTLYVTYTRHYLTWAVMSRIPTWYSLCYLRETLFDQSWSPRLTAATTRMAQTRTQSWRRGHHLKTALLTLCERLLTSNCPRNCPKKLPKKLTLLDLLMNWCLMSSDVMRHIRDKLWPMPKHGAINLYVHGNQKAR